MFAIVGETVYAPGQWAAGQAQLDEFWALRAAQPGFRGALQVDEGGGRYLTLLLWDSQAQWEAAHPLLSAAAARLLAPLRAGPTQPLGAGTVVYDTLTASVASA